ncbi:MAG: hypothetical protein LBG72_04065 [Spirochaetaceae bacterium]|jgi:hypothetical protein|nr:hypothetical protein [Spirochaetaceae bacterium]
MKRQILPVIFTLAAYIAAAQTPPSAAETTRPAPGAEEALESLLEKPALVKPARAAPLGKNWFRMETDAHIFTTQVTVKQVAAVFMDLENVSEYYNGKKSSLEGKVVGQQAGGTVVDFITRSFAGPITIKTPYRALVTNIANTPTKVANEVRQQADDSATNKDIKNLFATRYAEEVKIGGKTYTYIRIYTIDDVNASILPGAQGALERGGAPINTETLEMIIAAARRK